jgi:hypothetical protein
MFGRRRADRWHYPTTHNKDLNSHVLIGFGSIGLAIPIFIWLGRGERSATARGTGTSRRIRESRFR